MKKVGTYTIKGKLSGSSQEMIHLFDGKFTTGYKIVKFQAMAQDPANQDGMLSLFSQLQVPFVAPGSTQDFSNNSWIASAFSLINWNNGGNIESVIDPDNLIIEDLYVTSSGFAMNYLITMEKYEFDEARGALAMVRNNQQNVE